VSKNICFFGNENNIINKKLEIRRRAGYLKKLTRTSLKLK
jgi:hypothetical protein